MPIVERLAKTPKAWDALARPDLIGQQARALLLMANGRRHEKELSLLLGDDVSDLAKELQKQGYLQTTMPMIFGDGDPDTTLAAG